MKKIIITAIILIGAGLAVCLGILAINGFDFEGLSTKKITEKDYEVIEEFNDIQIDCMAADVHFERADNTKCIVKCVLSDKMICSVKGENGTLKITVNNQERWYDNIGIFTQSEKITVFLPKKEYDKLEVKTESGEIFVSDIFAFDTAEISSKSGDISFDAKVKEVLSLKTTSGEIQAVNSSPKSIDIQSSSGDVKTEQLKVSDDLKIKTTSGEIVLKNTQCRNGNIKSSSGDVALKEFKANEKITIDTDSGEVKLNRADAKSLLITGKSGDVTGTLLTDKKFITHTNSGSVSVPATDAQDICEISTKSGDIKINIA